MAVQTPKQTPNVNNLRRALLGSVVMGGAALATTLTASSGALAQEAPLENAPTRLGVTLETANQLHKGALQLTFGFNQTDPNAGPGTGNQIYFLAAEYGLTDRLSFGLTGQTFEDPVVSPINGAFPTIGLDSGAISAKYLAIDNGQLAMALAGSIELFRFTTPLYGTGPGGTNEGMAVGSVMAPISYQMNDQLQFTLTPGVSVFPDEINGTEFYGTVGHIGLGAHYDLTERLAGYAAVNVPVSGGNAIASDGSITQVAIWTAGARYKFTPKAALDFYVTNGIGTTSATSILANWPEGEDLLIGAKLNWTPGVGPGYRSSYRTLSPITERQKNLQLGGFTLASADTLEPGTLSTTAWAGTDDNYGGGFAIGLDQDGQAEFYVEERAVDGTVPAGLLSSNNQRYSVGLKLRFLDQNNGDPFTLSTRLLGGRELNTGTPGPGELFVEVAASYKVNPKLALSVNPKVGAFGNTSYYGIGFGANYELFDGFELIGEVTPTQDANGTVWSAGARYNVNEYGLSIDASATNAVGRVGLATMVAQDNTRFSLSVNKQFNLANWRQMF